MPDNETTLAITPPAEDPATVLGVEARRLRRAEVTIVVGGTKQAPNIDLEVALESGRKVKVPMPEPFVDLDKKVIHLGPLVVWLGLDGIRLVDALVDADPERAKWVDKAELATSFGLDEDDPVTEVRGGLHRSRSGEWSLRLNPVWSGFHRLRIGSFPAREKDHGSAPGQRGGGAVAAVAPPSPAATAPTGSGMAIDEAAMADAGGCLAFVQGRLALAWAIGLGSLGLIAIILIVLAGGDSDSGSTPADAAGGASDGQPADEGPTAVQRLDQLVQELVGAGSAAVEQTFTVGGPSGEQNEITAVGVIDLTSGEAQTEVTAQGQTFEAYIGPDNYSIDTGTGWVSTTTGELQDNPEAEAVGLSQLGIGEAMDPLGVAAFLGAAQNIEEASADEFVADVTLPVDGAGPTILAVYGRPQEELAGLTSPIGIIIGDDGSIDVEILFDFDAALDRLAGDPDAAALAGVSLTNRTGFSRFGLDAGITGPGPDARDLATVIGQLG